MAPTLSASQCAGGPTATLLGRPRPDQPKDVGPAPSLSRRSAALESAALAPPARRSGRITLNLWTLKVSVESSLGLSAEEQADAPSRTPPPRDAAPPPEAHQTTFKVSNFPADIRDQNAAVQWLNDNGFSGSYDFVLFIRAGSQPPIRPGFAVVNFCSAVDAHRFKESLKRESLAVKVVASKKQGLAAISDHFSSLRVGTATPWLKPDGPNSHGFN